MRTLGIVQARMGSGRLPGKSLEPVWGAMSLVGLVLERVRAACSLDAVVLAVPRGSGDDALAAEAARLGIPVVRGPEQDVLGRFALALARHPADAVVRVCADNPFVDPAAVDDLVAFFASSQPCDYASNHTAESGLPDGTGAEIISAAALRRAAAEATDLAEREHVTAHVRARPERYRLRVVPAPPKRWPFVRLDVDTAADLDRVRALARRLPIERAPLWDVRTLLDALAEATGEVTPAVPASAVPEASR